MSLYYYSMLTSIQRNRRKVKSTPFIISATKGQSRTQVPENFLHVTFSLITDE